MKEYLKSSLILAMSAAMAVSASAQKSACTTKAPAQNSTASGKKAAAKHTSGHGGKVQSGEASSLQKETGSDPRAMREENRGRLTAARHPASHARHVAKESSSVNHSSMPSSAGKNATLRRASRSHPKAGLKTSQLTTGKASRAQTKTVSTQRDVSTTIKKQGAKAPVNNSSKDPANNSSKSPALKPNNARMF